MKRVTALILSIILLFGFASCSKIGDEPTSEPSDAAASDDLTYQDSYNPEDYQPNEFDDELISYLCLNGYNSSDFIISPTAFRAALCLAAAGAQGNTRTELVNAAGFSGIDHLNTWYSNLKKSEESFSTRNLNGHTFSVASSVWNNKDLLGKFTDSYTSNVKEKYDADAYSYGSDEISNALNDWISKKSDGLIPTMADDAAGAYSLLLSTVNLRTAWKNTFSEASESKRTFVDANGNEQTIDFMEQTAECFYADVNGTKVLLIPMNGNMSFVCFLGNRIDRFNKITRLKPETVHVVLPKFELESVFDARDLLGFMLSRGVKNAISERTANFLNMCQGTDWFIQEIMQKNKVIIDEAGIGSVKTNVSDTSGTKNDADIKEFIVDRPFSFAIFSNIGTDNQHMLYYGQFMNCAEQTDKPEKTEQKTTAPAETEQDSEQFTDTETLTDTN